MTNTCGVCGVEASLKCSGCLKKVYCSKEHQIEDWRLSHKSECSCYEIQYNDVMGRYCVAGRDIKQGEVILKERPLVLGPKMLTTPVCLGCLKILQPSGNPLEYYKCQKCKWPMCGPACEQSAWHKDECNIFHRANYDCNIRHSAEERRESSNSYSCYCVILPLRVLYLKAANTKLFNKISTFESHLEIRKKSSLYQVLRLNLVKFINLLVGPEFGGADDILTVAGILDTNCFDVRVRDNSVNARGIYYEAAMFSHDCLPNARHLFRDDKKLIMFATRDIKKGEVINISYAQPLKNTVQRRKMLWDHKCFHCLCNRCCDPTEFGLYVNSLICPNCTTGKLVQVDATQAQSDYRCDKCDEILRDREVVEMREMFADKIKETQRSPVEFQYLLSTSNRLGHATCAEFLDIKYAMIQLYGDAKSISTKNIHRKTDICLQLLEVAKLIDNPLGCLRSAILKEVAPCLKRELKLNPGLSHSNKYEDIINEAEEIKRFEDKILGIRSEGEE